MKGKLSSVGCSDFVLYHIPQTQRVPKVQQEHSLHSGKEKKNMKRGAGRW